jgi:1,4-dihydroxy-2-naphthoyl-CoA hydrolase
VTGRLAWREGHAIATSRPLRVGRSVIVVETEVCDEAGKALSHTTQSQAVIAGGPAPAG